jgi:hypothetical protein
MEMSPKPQPVWWLGWWSKVGVGILRPAYPKSDPSRRIGKGDGSRQWYKERTESAKYVLFCEA